MKAITSYLFTEYRCVKEAHWLRKLLALFVVYKSLYWIMDYQLLFSPQSIVYSSTINLEIWRLPVFLLYNAQSSALNMIYLTITLAAGLYILFFKAYLRAIFFILWFTVSNINNLVFCSLSAGEYLFQHLLFFCIILSNNIEKRNPVAVELDKAFNNAGVLAIQIQVCLVYFLAGYTKLLDADWLNGTAVNDVFRIHHYSMPFLYESNSAFGKELNFLIIGYQLLFPILVWFKSIKKWYLLIGILQHLFIAFVMGLPSFGFIMIVSYAIFYVPGCKIKNS